MMKTFANKYRTTVSNIKRRYVKDGDFTVGYTTKSGEKNTVYHNKGFKRLDIPMFGQIDILEPYKKYDKPNSLASKLRAGLCELCGTECNDVVIHQVKRLKDLTGKSEWEEIMLSRRRKTLAVCSSCHTEIHKKD
jgi:hypothetical protein